jgi:hypothetical protein
VRHRHRRSLQRSLTDSEAAGSAPHPSAPHALGPEHARREHRSLPSRPMYMHAAVPSFWEVAMLSAPVFDSWEGPKRQSAIGDAILGKKFFPAYAHTLPVRPSGEGGPKTFFRKPPRHCAALVNSVSGGAGMPNRSRFGACTALEAATIVHDVRYVT